MNDNTFDPLTPQETQAVTGLCAATNRLDHAGKIRTLTLVLAAAIKCGAKSHASAEALVDLAAIQLRKNIRETITPEGLG